MEKISQSTFTNLVQDLVVAWNKIITDINLKNKKDDHSPRNPLTAKEIYQIQQDAAEHILKRYFNIVSDTEVDSST